MATAIGFALHGQFGDSLLLVTLFPALIIASALGGFLGGGACLAVATLGAVLVLPHPKASLVWLIGASWVAGGLTIAVTAALVGSMRELVLSQARLIKARAELQTFVGELAHRNRNALAVIKAIVSQSARGAGSAEAAEQIINGRLDALLRVQDVMAQSTGDSLALSVVVDKALEPFGADHFVITPGPAVEVESEVAIGLGLLLHELATNALKYGALTVSDGWVDIGWSKKGEFALFRWRELGGPTVTPPTRAGFGSRLLRAALIPQGGRVETRFDPEGFMCELHVPSRVTHPGGPNAALARALTPEVEWGRRAIHWES